MKRRFVEVCGDLIDLNMVVEVSELTSDDSWQKYDVYFEDGRKKFYYEKRDADPKHLKRKDFITLLLEYKINE